MIILLILNKKILTGSFNTFKIEVTLTVEQIKKWKNLETNELADQILITCSLNSDSQNENSCTFDFIGDERLSPISSEFEGDNIGGALDKFSVDKNNNPDY